MKNIRFYSQFFIALILLTGALFSSCEKVIILDLKNSPAEIVVQGNVINTPGPYTVILNYSVAYYNSNTFPAVTGALVKIYDNVGNSETLKEGTGTSQGIYKTDSLKGTPGRQYTIQITANGTTYTGSSTMPAPIPIDSFLLEQNINRFTNVVSTGYKVVCKFTDPAGVGHYYRVVIHSNDTAAIGSDSVSIISDKLDAGQQLAATFRTKLVTGDTLKVQLQCIDQSTYNFYSTINGAIGSASLSQILAAPPANPTNNISNKGLGYFAAYSVTSESIVVP